MKLLAIPRWLSYAQPKAVHVGIYYILTDSRVILYTLTTKSRLRRLQKKKNDGTIESFRQVPTRILEHFSIYHPCNFLLSFKAWI